MKLDSRNKLLIAGWILGLFVCYQFALKKSVEEIAAYRKNKALSKELADAPKLLFSLKYREKQLDSLIVATSISKSSDFQNDLLRFLSSKTQSGRLAIKKFSEPHLSLDPDKNRIYTYEIGLKGPFAEQLKVLNRLEVLGVFGAIRHLEFEKEKNYKTGTFSLESQIYLERREDWKNSD